MTLKNKNFQASDFGCSVEFGTAFFVSVWNICHDPIKELHFAREQNVEIIR